jgi:hypothetical protein
MPSETDLLELQRNFLAAIREPIYGGSRKLSSLPPRDGQVSPQFAALAESEIRSTPNLEATERLELYHRQYWFRLLDTIGEDFPALKHLLGEDTFWRLIEAYLEHVPSRSYNMRRLGSGLADFIGRNHGLAGAYPVHAVELARLEYALCDIFDAAAFPPVAAEALAATMLALQPHVRLFGFHTPADDIWRSDKNAEIPAQLLATHETALCYGVAVFRNRSRLEVRSIPLKAFAVLNIINQTGSLEDALELLDPNQTDAAEVAGWFRDWTELGWLCEKSSANSSSEIEVKEIPAGARPVKIPVHHS